MKRLRIYVANEMMAGTITLLLCLLALFGCAGAPNKTQPTFPIVHARELLLSQQAFPRSWQLDPCGVGCDRSEQPAHSIRTFGRTTLAGSVIQQVYVFEDVEAAQAQFVHLRDAEFAAWPPPKQTLPLTEAIHYQSAVANEVAIGCGKDEVEACKAFLRYRNYIVQFYFDIDEGKNDGLRVGDIAPILEDLDAQVTRVFRVDLSTSQ